MANMDNRKVFFLAVNTGYTESGVPDRDFLEFYANRSGKGLYCSIVGNVAIPNGFGTNNSTPRIDKNPIWRNIADTISMNGTIPGIQLSTTWQSYSGAKTFKSKTPSEQLDSYKKTASSFDKHHIKMQFSALKSASIIAIDSGYRHIQLHAAHGYFFNLVLDNRFSAHHDLATDLAKEWLQLTSQPGIETSIRISTLTGDCQLDNKESTFLTELLTLGFDYHDISEGFYNINKRLIYPSLKNILTERYTRSINLAKQHPQNNFIVSGKSYALKQKNLPENAHIGICRDLIANPNFLSETHKGCKNRMKCHYFSRGETSMTCGIWNTD